jgi:hypothetical protein
MGYEYYELQRAQEDLVLSAGAGQPWIRCEPALPSNMQEPPLLTPWRAADDSVL